MMSWTTAGPAITASFLASLVEVVEAFTIVLAVGTVGGWRPALTGTAAGLGLLGLLVLALGPVVERLPLEIIQLVIGILLLLFGMRWLRKAILRSAGIIALHDEELAYARETASLGEAASREATRRNWIAGLAAFKAIVLEGIEIVFVVVAVGAGRGLLWPAALGALAACAIVLVAGIAIHKPLSRVPENSLKFGVGVMLSAFGVYWTGEGLGVAWPGHDLALLALAGTFLAAGLALVPIARRPQGATR